MLPKRKRVDKKTFQILMKDGKTFSSSFFLLYFMDSEAPHYAFVAPKKAYKNAIKRNKYRRIGYNILRQLSITHGTAIFMYKKEAISAQKEEIQGNILFLLKKVRVLS